MSVNELLQSRRDEILEIAAKHGAFNVRIFGSAARGEARPDSDVDFLVDAGSDCSSYFPAGLILDLEDLLGRKVDIVEEKGLYATVKDYVLKDAKPV